MNDIDKFLKSNIDNKYRLFILSLIPNVDDSYILGVRAPLLKSYAKKVDKSYLNILPHKYYEEYLLQIYMINNINNFDEVIFYLDKLLPYLKTWSETDAINPKAFNKRNDKMLDYFYKLLKHPNSYAKRLGVRMLMKYFLGDYFKIEYLEKVLLLYGESYYLDMMVSWYLTEGLINNYKDFYSYLNNNNIPSKLLSMTIRKSLDSYKLDKIKKEEIRKLK